MRKYIDNIAEADYVEMESGISDSTTTRAGSQVIDWLTRQLDQLTAGRKGGIATDAIILAGLAKDPTKLRGIYNSNKDAYNAYFDQVDTQALVNQFGVQQKISTTTKGYFKRNLPGLIIGFVGGVVISKIL